MNKSDEAIMLEYINSIQQGQEIHNLDTGLLSDTGKTLGEALNHLGQNLEQLKRYAEALSDGNLSVDFPPRNVTVCNSLKNLHANLNHLAWQAVQIAAGDYSQQVLYMGEFSDAFNVMIRQLSEREDLLKKIAREKEGKAQLVQTYNEMFVSLMEKREEWIFVMEEQSHVILYCNKEDHRQPGSISGLTCRNRVSSFLKLMDDPSTGSDRVVEVSDPETHNCYLVNRYQVVWQGSQAMAYIVEDVTKERADERRLAELAYKDTFTGIYNRRYIMEYLERLLQEGAWFSLCYIDINHLKHVNDTYGHQEGDRYIKNIVKVIREGIRTTDTLARVGGDEFIAILLKCPKEMAEKKMSMLYEEAIQLPSMETGYQSSFSFGIVETVPSSDENGTIDELLGRADSLMYQFKQDIKVE